MRASVIVTMLGLVSACAEGTASLSVWVDTDYDTPEELSFVTAEVFNPSGKSVWTGEWSIGPGGTSIPFSFEVSPINGDTEQPVLIEVRGFERQGGRLLTVQRVRTGFLPDRTLVLPVFLYRACEEVWRMCPDGQTCEGGECADDFRDPNRLSEQPPASFDGGVGRRDGGSVGSDAGTPLIDAGADAGAAADAGLVDTGAPDGGPCHQVATSPSMFHRISLPHPVDLPLSVGDVDGDGLAEFVAATQQGSFSIIDFDSCGPPSVRTVNGPASRLGAWVQKDQGPALYFATDSAVLGYGIEHVNVDALGMILSADRIGTMSAAPTGRSLTVVARQIDWGYLVHDPRAGTNLFHTTSRPVVSELAYFQTTTSSRAEFVGVDESSALLGLRAEAPPIFLGSFDGAHEPVVVHAGGLFAGQGEDVVGVLVPRGSRLHTGRVDRSTYSGSFTVSDFASNIVGEPIPSFQEGGMRVFLQLADGRVERCSLGGTAFLSCSAPSESSGLSLSQDQVAGSSLILGYVSSGDDADLILVSNDGEVSFNSGRSLSTEVAPPVDLGKLVTAHAALAPFLLDGLGSSGSVLAVPHENGEISFVAWHRPLGPANDRELWTMYRRDVTRSAYVP